MDGHADPTRRKARRHLPGHVAGRHVARGEFEEVTPNSRIVYSFGWESGEVVPPGSSKIEIDLAPRDRGTLLTFVHSGLPASQVEPHTDD